MNDFGYSNVDVISSGAYTTSLWIGLAVSIFLLVCYVKIFQKAGKPGWHAIIPFLNTWDMMEFATGAGWHMFLLLIPFFNIIYMIIFSFRLAKAFGKGTGFGFGLWLLPVIFIPILAFGDAQYVGAAV